MSARTAADVLGHARTSMTQDVYMSRGTIHTEVADLLERAVINARINVEPIPETKTGQRAKAL